MWIWPLSNWTFLWKVKPVLSGHSKMDKTKILMSNESLMKVESIAECSHWSILQNFWPALSDYWCSKPIFFLLEGGRLRQVLLYHTSPQFLYNINSLVSSYKHVFTSKIEYSVDHDQLASEKPADLDLHCLLNRIYPGLCGHLLGKGWPLDSRLWCLIVKLSLSPLVSLVRCGAWLYQFLIFALCLT